MCNLFNDQLRRKEISQKLFEEKKENIRKKNKTLIYPLNYLYRVVDILRSIVEVFEVLFNFTITTRLNVIFYCIFCCTLESQRQFRHFSYLISELLNGDLYEIHCLLTTV